MAMTRTTPMNVCPDIADRARACQILVARADLQHLWTAEGPTELAEQFLAENGGTMSSSQRSLFLMAWIVWKGPVDPTKLKVSDLLGIPVLDDLHLVGSLLVAIS